MKRIIVALLLLGCPKDLPITNAWEATPHLPSPHAGAYTRSNEAPPDRAIARLAQGKLWDASLSGAAGALAVMLSNPNGPKALTRWGVREALWRAGYPYPISDAKAWLAREDGSPPPQLLEWLAKVGPEADLGLVRSRGHDIDVFVGLVAHPKLNLPPFPRQVATGGTLRIPAIPNATYAIADANGRFISGDLGTGATIDMPSQGEWLVQIRQEGLIASFPVYVGIVPPHTALIEKTVSVRDGTEALTRATELLKTIRSAYGSPAPSRDFMLDAGARRLLDEPTKPSGSVVTSLGLNKQNAAVFTCHGSTVEVCIDAMVWKPENRRALLDDDARLGLAARMDAEGVHLVGILSPTE